MTLTQIHALLAVLEYGGFTEASKRLYMTQSAVSQAISALEEELGVDILIRERRKEIELTAAGSRIVRHLRAIQRDVNAVKEIAEQEKKNPARTLRIGCFPSACACILPGVIRYFESHHPNVKIILMKRTVRLLLIHCRTEVLMPVSFLFRSTVCIASPFTGINSP
ncbi:transcriptional regulator [Salmonella enterica subsp. enterica]|uniref:Transcriptional regulator n=1 Tax=Salmonella enterica I TaxID=59201 RepID=A0A379UTF4_SALET|nr:transcriptional regulator [Salmonella enterica subsp. enterica]